LIGCGVLRNRLPRERAAAVP